MTTPAELRPSSFKRVIHCPGSVGAQRGRSRPSSPYALEGTLAHAFAARLLSEGETDVKAFRGGSLDLDGYAEPQILDDEMADAIQVYLDYFWEMVAEAGTDAEWHVEVKVAIPTQGWPTPIPGTSDGVIWSPRRAHVDILDYKHGVGVAVDAFQNAQCMLYALGAVRTLGYWPRTLRVHIIQPRAYHWRGPIRSYAFNFLELLAFAVNVDDAAKAAHDALDGNPMHVRYPGEWCRWCSAAWNCPALLMAAVPAPLLNDLLINGRMSRSSLPDPRNMSNELLGKHLDLAETLSTWIREVRDEASHRLKTKRPVPGYKLVEAQARRKWDPALTEEAIAATIAKAAQIDPDDLFRRKIAPITEVERIAYGGKRGKAREPIAEAMMGLTIRDSTTQTIVREDDPREAIAHGNPFDGIALPG